MTRILTLIVIAVTVGLTFTACKKQDQSSTPATITMGSASIDMTEVNKQFQGAASDIRADLENAILQLRSGNYPEAMGQFKFIASNTRLTPEQQQAIKNLLAKVQGAIASGATKALPK